MKKILIAVLSAGVLVVSCTKEAPEVLPEVSDVMILPNKFMK